MKKNAESALVGFEKQAVDALAAQKKAKPQLALAMAKTKQQQKKLEAKDEEKAKAEQAAYDASMTKTAQSLKAQLRDIAQVFFLEVWGQALTIARVSIESELKAPDKVYYPLALRLAPNPPPPATDLSSTSTLAQPTAASVVSPVVEKE